MYVINPRKNKAFFFLVEIFALWVWKYLLHKTVFSSRDAIPIGTLKGLLYCM